MLQVLQSSSSWNFRLLKNPLGLFYSNFPGIFSFCYTLEHFMTVVVWLRNVLNRPMYVKICHPVVSTAWKGHGTNQSCSLSGANTFLGVGYEGLEPGFTFSLLSLLPICHWEVISLFPFSACCSHVFPPPSGHSRLGPLVDGDWGGATKCQEPGFKGNLVTSDCLLSLHRPWEERPGN